MTSSSGTHPPPWRNVRVLRAGGQTFFLLTVGTLIWFFLSNLSQNLNDQNLPTGWDYLEQPTNFRISGAEDFRPTQPVWKALLIGLKNTALVSFAGIVLASVLGLFLGMGRLSNNWLIRKAVGFYTETIRNIPLLVLIIFLYFAIVLRLPNIKEPFILFDTVVVSQRGIWLPWTEGDAIFWGAVLLAATAAGITALWRTKRSEQTGIPHHRVLYGAGAFVFLTIAGYFLMGSPVSLTLPEHSGRHVDGGIKVLSEYLALLLGLTLYTASHIGEIIRGSIQAVPKGQSEAANTLALSAFHRMRFVVLPQAARIMLPLLTNQYLNLVKNSSLAVAIGYMEITQITRLVMNQGNPGVPNIALLMLFYLVFSLCISALTNVLNQRLQYVGH